jgi:hypothetical protein
MRPASAFTPARSPPCASAEGRISVDLGAAVLAEPHVGRAERDGGRLGGVEEVRGEQVLPELRDDGLDGVDLGRAGEDAILERSVDLLELPAERRDAVVLDGEAQAAVDRVELVGAGRYRLKSRGCHGNAPFWLVAWLSL